jgi:hypothetical protein
MVETIEREGKPGQTNKYPKEGKARRVADVVVG